MSCRRDASSLTQSARFGVRNKHMMIDLGTGNNNKINWAMNNKQELIDIIECIYRGARKGGRRAVLKSSFSSRQSLARRGLRRFSPLVSVRPRSRYFAQRLFHQVPILTGDACSTSHALGKQSRFRLPASPARSGFA